MELEAQESNTDTRALAELVGGLVGTALFLLAILAFFGPK